MSEKILVEIRHPPGCSFHQDHDDQYDVDHDQQAIGENRLDDRLWPEAVKDRVAGQSRHYQRPKPQLVPDREPDELEDQSQHQDGGNRNGVVHIRAILLSETS